MKLWKNFKKKSKEKSEEVLDPFDVIIKGISKHLEVFIAAIETMKKKYNTEEIPKVINHALMFKLHLKDIITEWQRISNSQDEVQKNLGYRSLSLHLYEFLNGAKAFLGNSFRTELRLFPNRDFLCSELDYVKKWYNALKNRFLNKLGDIRHNTIAHKNENSLKLNRFCNEIDFKDIDEIMFFVFLFMGMILNFDNNILESVSITKSDISETEKQKEFQSLKPSKNILTTFLLIIKGYDAKTATQLSDPKVQQKIKEVLEYMDSIKYQQADKKT